MHGCLHTLTPKMFQMLVIIPYLERHAVAAVRAAVRVVCALWSGHGGAVGVPLQAAGAGLLAVRVVCVQFGAGRLVALRVLLQVLPESDA